MLVLMNVLAIYLEFAKLSERNFGLVKKPIDFWLRKGRLAGSQCRPRTNIAKAASEGTYIHGPQRYTCFLCLSLLKGCLPLRGEGSLWQATGSNRALVAKKFTYR